MQAVMWIEPAVAILQHKKRGYLQQPEQVVRRPFDGTCARIATWSLGIVRRSALVEEGS